MQFTRSRAAVLCFGGWGLQTMLHLWPRLRFIQEERYDTGIDRQLLDLNRLTAFAAIVPDPVVPDPVVPPASHAYTPLRIVRPRVYRDPFYVERLLGQVEPQLNGDRRYTYAERIAQGLIDLALHDTNLAAIEEFGLDTIAGAQHQALANLGLSSQEGERLSRRDMFQIGIASAGVIVRSLLRHVVDPTRLDHVQPRDPYVQTTVYVVGSLAEPMASVLIWPIVSELVATLGARSVVSVSAILSTGSFATDDTRVIEEASSHVALRELEALTDIRGAGPKGRGLDQGIAALHNLIAITGGNEWKKRAGQPLFDHIYLIDREKSNQSLARDAFEQVVLAGNAIEAFLIADGSMHIEARIGAEITRRRSAPYSLIGAANNYVPLAQYLNFAVDEERKRIVRELFLAQPDDDPTVTSPLTLPRLDAAPEAAVRSLLQPRARRMFAPDRPGTGLFRRIRRRFSAMVGRRAPSSASMQSIDWLQYLRVAQSYVMPPHVVAQLRRERQLWRWRLQAEQHLHTVTALVMTELRAQRFEDAWGLNYTTPAVEDAQIERTLRSYRDRTWAGRYQQDRRTIPMVAFRTLEHTLRTISQATGGLPVARQQIEHLVEEVEQCRDMLRQAEPEELRDDWDMQFDARLRTWLRDCSRVEGRAPHALAVWTRAALAGTLFGFPLIAWLLLERRTPTSPIELVLAAATCLLVTLSIGAAVIVPHRLRIRRLQHRRITLAQEMISRNARQIVYEGLIEIYERMHEELRPLQEILQTTIETLGAWSQPLDPPGVPPAGIEPVHLHTAHTSLQMWTTIKQQIRLISVDGATSEEHLRRLWTRDGFRRDWLAAGKRLGQRLRLAVELPLNEREHQQAQLLEAQRRQRESARPGAVGPVLDQAAAQQEVDGDVYGNAWCPFATVAPNRGGPIRCTACYDAEHQSCPFSEQMRTQGALPAWHPWSLEALIREQVDAATSHLLPQRRVTPERPAIMLDLVRDYNIERMLTMHQNGHGGNGADLRRELVEEIFARAKPAANYDVADTLNQQIIEVDFGVTTDGARSAFFDAFQQRKITLLASHDPMSIAVIRTIHCLKLEDLFLASRAEIEFARLNPDDRLLLALLRDDKEIQRVYGLVKDVVSYEKIFPQPGATVVTP